VERASPWIVAFAACAMILVGVGLAFTDRAASADAAWGIGFLLMALVLISKFKRFKGFGFEAEMWEQKLEKAATLIDQLQSMSKILSKQVASVAARAGLWDSALSLADLADVLKDLQKVLTDAKISPHDADEVLARIYQRITAAYHAEARHELGTAFGSACDEIHGDIGSSDAKIHLSAVGRVADMNRESQLISTLPLASIDSMVGFVTNSKVIEAKAATIDRLREIERDLQHFKIHHSFRRREWLPTVAH